jgi:hypothetical protein
LPSGGALIGPVLLVVIWETASQTGLLSPRLLAAPSTAITTGARLLFAGPLLDHFLASAGRAYSGLAIGVFLGVVLALLAGLTRAGDALIDGLVQIKRAIPQSRGHHEAAWRHPAASQHPLTSFNYYREIAQKAEAGLFDSVFFADHLAVGLDIASVGRAWMEPITTLAALAATTSRIGLIATASTTYTEPLQPAAPVRLDRSSQQRVRSAGTS